jgi:probable rRNA maturation factor
MPASDTPVIFQCGSARLDRTGLRTFAKELRDRVTKSRPFDVLITRDAELQRLNREFLGHDYPTDVLSFRSEFDDGFVGEIAISLDRARAQAAEHGHDVSTEIRILMLHGALHLIGMDHETDGGRMRRAETRLRKSFQLPTGLIERVRA